MSKALLLVIVCLAIFTIVKVTMIIVYSNSMKPKVDENGNIIKSSETAKSDKELDDNWRFIKRNPEWNAPLLLLLVRSLGLSYSCLMNCKRFT